MVKRMVTRLVLVCVSLILTGTFTLQSSAAIDMEDAAGIWLFDEGNGDVAKDSSGKGNDGKLINGPEWVDGKYGTALEFDGSSTSVETEHDDSMNLGDKTDFTAVAWFKTTGEGFIMTKTVDPGAWVGFEVKLVNAMIRTCLQTVPVTVCDNRGSGLTDGEFHHVAAVFSRTEGKRWIYIDGELQGDPIDQSSVVGSIDNEGGLAIGVRGADHDAGTFFTGVIDEAALFTTALSEDDVKEVMNDGLGSLVAVSPSGSLITTWGEIRRAF